MPIHGKLGLLVVGALILSGASWAAEPQTREFPAKDGGKLVLDLRTGGSVTIVGTGGSAIVVDYTNSCQPDCEVRFEPKSGSLEIATGFVKSSGRKNSNLEFAIRVPRRFDIELDSMGGDVAIDGVEGNFSGETMGGKLVLHDLRGEAELKTMGGEIKLTDSDLDGSLETMGGEVLFENVIGNVKGSSMGGNVRYKNVQRRDGALGSPPRIEGGSGDASTETVQISTMGGDITVDAAPAGAELHTMGGDIRVSNAQRFVRAETMGGDIEIAAADGSVRATTMGGDIRVKLSAGGDEIELTSMAGDIELSVPAGLGMELDLQIAFTRNSRQTYRIQMPGDLKTTVTPEWEYDHGSPRKYIRASGPVGGGGPKVTIRTVNGNITIH